MVIKEKFFKFLSFLNLLDEAGRLSITNIAVIALVVKMCLVPNLDWPSVTAMVITFANYMHKRSNADASATEDATDEMKKVKDQYEAAVAGQAVAIKTLEGKINGLSQLGDLLKLKPRI